MRKPKNTEEETKQITKEILLIREKSGLKNAILRDFMKLKEGTYRNKISSACTRTIFNSVDLANLKIGIKNHFQNYNHN